MEKIFVYGTLKSGYWNNSLLSSEQILSYHGVTEEPMLMLEKHFPYVMGGHPSFSKPLLPIKGEVYSLSKNTLSFLDYLEGYPSLYDRKKINVIDLETNEIFRDCYIYYLPTPKLTDDPENLLTWVSPVFDHKTKTEFYEWTLQNI